MNTTAKIADPFGQTWQMEPAQPAQALPAAPAAGSATDNAMAGVITAQRVAVKRDIADVIRRVTVIGKSRGRDMYYSIPFKDRKTGQTTYVEGISIGGAMVVATEYGNIKVGARISEVTPTHWMIEAQVNDLERGTTIQRPFLQRRNQNTGMRDQDRATDMVFQIGVSKAMRNAVNASLKWLCDELVDAAKSGLQERIGGNPDGARQYIISQFAAMDMPLSRVERIIGRAAARWTVPDMARLYAEIQTINDGMADIDEMYPAPEEEASAPEEPPAPAPKPAAKPKPKPAAEPVPEPVVAEQPQEDAAPEDGEPEQEEPPPPPARQAKKPAAPAKAEPQADDGDDLGGLQFT
jgi:hypothetical protein